MPFTDFPLFISEYQRISSKESGANKAGYLTGIYKINLKGIEYSVLFKQGRNDAETICELLAHKIYELIIPGYSSRTFFATENNILNSKYFNGTIHPNIYVGSIFFDTFTEAHKLLGFLERPRFFQTFHSRDMGAFINRYKDKYNLEKLLATALWLGDYDVHLGNIGLADVNDKESIVKIDHGWSFAKIQDIANRKKTPWSGLNAIGKPTNHFDDYDFSSFYASPSFKEAIKSIKSISYSKILETLEITFKLVDKYYSLNAYKSLADWIGYNSKNSYERSELYNFLATKLENRKKLLQMQI